MAMLLNEWGNRCAARLTELCAVALNFKRCT